MACGEFGCKTELRYSSILFHGTGSALAYLPAISDATLPKAVVVVVAADLMRLMALFKMRLGFKLSFSMASGRDSSDRPTE